MEACLEQVCVFVILAIEISAFWFELLADDAIREANESKYMHDYSRQSGSLTSELTSTIMRTSCLRRDNIIVSISN